MTNTEFVKKVTDIANNYKTLYVMGCFGAPMTAANKSRYCQHTAYNQQATRQKLIRAATADTFGFDCVCLIKGVLWGWSGNKNATYGGAAYASNGVPDIGADAMITKCSGISTDFSKITPGEAVWMSGHIGVYIGDGKVVECTPAWDNCVQITQLGSATAYKTRKWTKHGKLPWITYTSTAAPAPAQPAAKKTVDELAAEVRAGKWGVQPDREKRLTAAGYDFKAIQDRVNELEAAEKAKAWTPSVGDIVNFNGKKHYSSANASSGPSCKSGKAKITAIYQLGKSKHPYHLVAVPGGGSTVYGWVDQGSFTKA